MKFKLVIFIMIAGLAIGCKKDLPDDISTYCERTPQERLQEIVGPGGGYIITFSEDRLQYKAPYFNPLNGDEFVYYYKDNEEQMHRVVKYNMATRGETILAESYPLSRPKWSRRGWIVYTQSDYQIWVVKENGDSLHQVTENIANIFPVWDAVGQNIYYQHALTLSVPYYFLRMNFHTSQIDTIFQDGDLHEGFVGKSDISSNNILAAVTSFNNTVGIGVMNLNESPLEFEKLPDIDVIAEQGGTLGGITDVAISPEGNYSYVAASMPVGNSFGGLYRINNVTGENSKIMNFCWNMRYIGLSVSPDGKYLIGERVDAYTRPDNLNKIIENSSIYLIDLQTMEETPIFIGS